jgi:hypothetical protein
MILKKGFFLEMFLRFDLVFGQTHFSYNYFRYYRRFVQGGWIQILARISYKKGGDLGVCVHAVLDSRAPPGGVFSLERLNLSPYLAHFSGASRDVLEGREGNGAFDFFELS